MTPPAGGTTKGQAMKRRWSRIAALVAGLSVCVTGSFAADKPAAGKPQAAPDKPPAVAAREGGPDLVTLNFANTDIEGVVKVVGEITGKNFVLDPRVKGTVNVVSAKPIPRGQVYAVFLSALRLQGFAAVEERGVTMILPEIEAKFYRGTTDAQGKPRGRDDVVQTQVFTLQHQPAAQMVAVLRPLIPANNAITAYANSNTLVITDYASNLQRIQQVIEAVDQPDDTEPVLIQLRHASALDVAQTITKLMTEPTQAADPTARFTITADARTNSVLAKAGSPSRLARMRQLVAMLDSPTSAAGNIHVIYLKNAVATKVAEVLRAVYSGDSAPAAAARTAVTPLAQGQVAAPATSGAPAPGIIQADPATNALIITAPDAIYNNLRAVVEKLDVRRAQVYVEALIAEVSAQKAAEFGIQWQSINALGATSKQAFGATNFGGPTQNIVGIAANPAAAGRGLNVGVVKGTINIPGVGEILNLGMLVRALESDGNTNILSTPNLLTLDNEEAKIVIGKNLPFITGQYAVTAQATTPTPFQTIERRDVGLTLRIKPQISEGTAIRLQLFQEASSVFDATNPAGPVTNKRSIESTVLVDDGQIVAIGGLMDDSVEDGVEKVPGLGDIPVLGHLFRYNTRKRTKTNLMVFLRPVVMRSAGSLDPITNDRYNFMAGEQMRLQPGPMNVLPDYGTPVLPPREAPAPTK